MHRAGRRLARTAATVTAVACALATGAGPVLADDGDDHPGAALYLVTLDGPGTSGLGRRMAPDGAAAAMLAVQDDLLASVHAGEPLYRWTTALNGFAVELDDDQVDVLDDDPQVALVEPNQVVPLASTRLAPIRSSTVSDATRRGGAAGAGVVIGVVDTGIDPRNPGFRVAAGLGPAPSDFDGTCADAPDDPRWSAGSCNAKVVGAQFFVGAYGEDALQSTAVRSPYDTDGHGTAMATIAAGAADVRVRAGGHRLGRFSGVAPGARVAAYKACWTAPDPDDDGCATADVVAAIDRATADGVDVLNLSLGGPSTIDTVERALLGAAEAGVVVTAAAGNGGADAYAAHPSPWVTTVGATTDGGRIGDVVIGGLRLRGASSAATPVSGRLVRGADVPADGVRRTAARTCEPGSLDAAQVDGRIVLCVRGGGARIQKSETVALAGGTGMVLVNTHRGSVDADLHAVPTVHLAAPAARRLLARADRMARHGRDPRVRLVPRGEVRAPARVSAFSAGGDPTSPVLKPDLVAPGTEVVAATPQGWDLVSGTSAAAARVAGAAAVLLARPGATAPGARSSLLTTASPLRGDGLRSGAGSVRVGAEDPDLALEMPPTSYRPWLTGDRTNLNLPQALLANGKLRVRRTLTNTSGHVLRVTAHAVGFHDPVTVSPAAAWVRPGDTVRFTIAIDGVPTSTDDGYVLWHADSGETVRIPVVVTR